jgi:hypothetical protein
MLSPGGGDWAMFFDLLEREDFFDPFFVVGIE